MRFSAASAVALSLTLAACANFDPPASSGPASNDVAAFSEDLTQRTFRYFWDTTDTERCLAPDRWSRRVLPPGPLYLLHSAVYRHIRPKPTAPI